MASRVRALWGVRLAAVLACIAAAAPASTPVAAERGLELRSKRLRLASSFE